MNARGDGARNGLLDELTNVQLLCLLAVTTVLGTLFDGIARPTPPTNMVMLPYVFLAMLYVRALLQRNASVGAAILLGPTFAIACVAGSWKAFELLHRLVRG